MILLVTQCVRSMLRLGVLHLIRVPQRPNQDQMAGVVSRTSEVVRAELDPKQHQGTFGEAFVRVLASAAGLTVASPYPDVTGEDFIVGRKGRIAGAPNPKIDVQVKSWSRSPEAWDRRGFWKYRLSTEHFNNLAEREHLLPRYLFLVIVPKDPARYAVGGQGELVLSHAAYWVSLTGQPWVDPNVQGTVSVDVPVRNLLTVESLLGLMDRRIVHEETRS